MKVANSRFFLGALIITAVAALGACELVASVDREKIPQEGTGGVAGNPDGGDVSVPDVVTDKPTDVQVEGDAQPASCTNGIKDGTETDKDCGGSCTTKCAVGDGCGVGADCTTGVCNASKKCAAASCTDTVKNGDETDTDCGGSCALKCKAGKGCAGNGDCETGVCDTATKKCSGASCTDTIMNGTETDIDCGGGACPACSDDKKCGVDTDCTSGYCDPTAHKCNPAACDNGHKDSNETDTDCGGSCTTKCADTKGCLVANDCVSGVCDTGATPKVCLAPTCTDTVMNGSETDTDCGGSCTTKCADTKKCLIDGDCTSAHCDPTQKVCEPANCNDTVLNGDETDIDCGGTCPKCADTKICKVSNDCTSLNCDSTLHCLAATCTDAIKNQGESDIDCGGTGNGCPRCADAKDCGLDGDCQTNHACDPSTTKCVECLANGNCALGTLCDTAAKTCTLNGCVAGSHECPQTPTALSCCGGTCSDTTTDPLNCGACDNSGSNKCSNNHIQTPTCAASVCNGACEANFADCNTNKLTDGCEASLQTDANNCSACGTICSSNHVTASCAAGVCSGACEAGGWNDCDSNKQTDGCEANTQTEPAHCGTCTNVCALPNAVDGCASGACTIASCNAGYKDCNATATDGCEKHTDADPANCGTCGTICNLPNSVEGCAAGACTIASCNAGYKDCNATATDGCEKHTDADPANCGTCGTVCALPNTTVDGCAAGACTVTTCTAGYKDCNGTAPDGCEKHTDVDPANCGTCGTVCALPNAVNGCAAGACTITSCNAGFANCNGTLSDGCEQDIATDPANCGACAHVCGNSGTCAANVCVCGTSTCTAGQVCTAPGTCG